MNRTRIIWVCSALAIVALVLLTWLYESSLGPTYNDAGTDFGLEGNGVRVAFTFTPKKLRPGDSLDVVIKLGNIPVLLQTRFHLDSPTRLMVPFRALSWLPTIVKSSLKTKSSCPLRACR